MIRESTAVAARQNLGDLLNQVQYRNDAVLITKDGHRVMIVALTLRQWHNLVKATGLGEAFDALLARSIDDPSWFWGEAAADDRAAEKAAESFANRSVIAHCREALAIAPHVPLVMCDARHRTSARDVLVALIEVAVFAAFGLYQKWWRYVSGRDFLLIVRAVAVSSAILVVAFTVLRPFAHNIPRSNSVCISATSNSFDTCPSAL